MQFVASSVAGDSFSVMWGWIIREWDADDQGMSQQGRDADHQGVGEEGRDSDHQDQPEELQRQWLAENKRAAHPKKRHSWGII